MKKLLLLGLSFFLAFSLAAETKKPLNEQLSELGFQVPKKEAKAADFTITGLDGKKFKLSDNKDKIILLNQWATWCPPCKAEMPSIQRLFDKVKSKKFLIAAVSVGEEKAVVADFIKKSKYTFPIYLDETNKATADYSTGSIPTTYLIGKNNMILGRIVGSIEWDTKEIMKLLEDLLKE